MSSVTLATPPVPDAGAPAPRAGRGHLWLLLTITVFGGVLRFATISRPPIWGDEASTFARVSGSFRDLLDLLQYDGFVPLHYELYWFIQHYVAMLTPPVLRFVPALCGTLMIPAVYFLAVQMVSRRAALLAALFTCVSAYMMVYSHDAKMYADCWFFCTLSGACLLWWLRCGRRVAWLAWVASALAASGLHVWGLLPSGLGLVFALSRIVVLQRPLRQWLASSSKQLLGLLLGTVVIGAGTGGFYLGFNRMVRDINDLNWGLPWAVSWVQHYNQGRSGPDLVLFTATAHLYSWEWPSGEKFGYIPPARLHWLQASGVLLLLLLALGMLPWAKRRLSSPSPGTLGDGERPLDAGPIEPPWRRTLWLAIWIILPCYGFYCFSMRQFASPLSWFVAVGDLFSQHWIALALVWLILGVVFLAWPLAARIVGAAGLIAAATTFAILLLSAPWKFAPAWRELATLDGWSGLGNALWDAGASWMNCLSQPLVLGALAAVMPPLLWYFSAATLAQRMRRTIQYLAVAATCLLLCLAMYGVAQCHYRSQVRKILTHHEELPDWNNQVRQAMKDHGIPTRETALRRILSDRPAASPAVAQNAADDLIAQAHAQWDALVASAQPHDSAPQFAAQQIAAQRWVWQFNWASEWMPRYLGEIWPALAVAVCCLLLRLPTRALRYSAITLLLALNATQTGARLFAGSEPPMQIIAADVLAAQPQTPDGRPTNSSTRTYFKEGINGDLGGHPGTMSLLGHELTYYLEVSGCKVLRPREFRDLGSDLSLFQRVQGVEIVIVGSRHTSLAHDLQTHPQTRRVIVWDHLPAPKPGVNLDAYADAANLGNDWKLVSDRKFVGRMHWVWQDLYTLRRREYEKSP